MAELILLRHAHASPPLPGGADHERPLSARGVAEGQHAAQRLLEAGLVPVRVLLSPSLRTVQTAELLQQALQLPPDALRLVPELYLARPAVLRSIAAASEPGLRRLLIIGHNSGLSELAAQLLSQPDLNLATAQYCSVNVAGGWNTLEP